MFLNNSITRLPNGLSTVSDQDIFNSLPYPNPTAFHQYFEDFDTFVASDWTVTETQAGATQALANGDGGLLLLTNSAADNDVNQIQKVGESFALTPGKALFFAARFQISDATQADAVVGLQVTNTDATGAVTDGMYFIKADDATSISVVLRKNTTTGSTTAVVTNIVAATNIVLKAFYDGVDRLYYGFNNTVIGYLDASSAFLPDTTLSPVVCIKNGDGNARTMTVDYLFVAAAR